MHSTPNATFSADGAAPLAEAFDPFDLTDPFPVYRRARREAPAFYSPKVDSWVLSRYEDIKTVLNDWRIVAAMAERVHEAFGAIDVLVNNAALYGTLTRKPFFEIAAEEWDRVQAVNLKGAFLCAKAAFAHMRGRGGRIVNIASASALSGSPLWLHYVASKGGMIAMTRGMARELGEHRITVNAVAPGFTLTEASRKIGDNAATWGVDRGAIRRAEQPEDVVGAVLWLASPHSDFVTGQTLIVDGGRQFL